MYPEAATRGVIFRGMLPDILENVLEHSEECRHTSECSRTFSRIFGNIPRIPFPVSVFLILYIARQDVSSTLNAQGLT